MRSNLDLELQGMLFQLNATNYMSHTTKLNCEILKKYAISRQMITNTQSPV